MFSRCCVACVVAFFLMAATVEAQQTTVQLPTFQTFTVQTSVLVPDRGSSYLGGIGSSVTGRSGRGLPGLGGLPAPIVPGNRGIGGSQSASGMSVSAYIHDFEAMDQALLRGAKQPGHRQALNVTAAGAPAVSLAQIRTQQAADAAQADAEAQGLIERGRKAEAEGKLAVAKTYYRLAAQQAGGDVQREAHVALRRMEPGQTPLALGRVK